MTSMFFFFFNDTATTEIYTLSLHDALPIWVRPSGLKATLVTPCACPASGEPRGSRRARSHVTTVPSPDRKSTRLNSSHGYISYAVFCLKKNKNDEDSDLHCYYVSIHSDDVH